MPSTTSAEPVAPAAPGPLAGVTVLDLASVGPAARCTRLLADYGADLVKVGPVPGDAGTQIAPPFFAYSGQRGARRALLDLKAEAGRRAFLALAAGADVVVESFRPGVVDRLGVGYQAVREVNPAVVYCSTSGYGQAGPALGLGRPRPRLPGRGGLPGLERAPGRRRTADPRGHRGRRRRRRDAGGPGGHRRALRAPGDRPGRPPRRVGGRRRAVADVARRRRAPGHRVRAGTRPRRPLRPLRLLRHLPHRRRAAGWPWPPSSTGSSPTSAGPSACERWVDHQLDDGAQAQIRADFAAAFAANGPRPLGGPALGRRHLRGAGAHRGGGGRRPRVRRAGVGGRGRHPERGAFRQLAPLLAGMVRSPGPVDLPDPSSPTPRRSWRRPASTPRRSAPGGTGGRSRERPDGRGGRADRGRAVLRGGGVPGRTGLRLDDVRLGGERQPPLLGRRGGRGGDRRTDRPAHHALGLVPPAPLGAGPRPGGAAAAGPLRPEGPARTARGGDDRQHHHLLRAGAPGGPAPHPPGAAQRERGEDDQARDRALLGHRGRLHQPARTSWWGSSPTPASATAATGATP